MLSLEAKTGVITIRLDRLLGFYSEADLEAWLGDLLSRSLGPAQAPFNYNCPKRRSLCLRVEQLREFLESEDSES